MSEGTGSVAAAGPADTPPAPQIEWSPRPQWPGSAMRDLIVVANRLPLTASGDDRCPWVPSPGGLIGAVWPALRRSGGTWVGWPGAPGPVELPEVLDGVAIEPVELSPADYEQYYEGFSNATLWPLYHDAIQTPVYEPAWWGPYQAVNERFADAIARIAAPNATVWIQDYHLQLVPKLLRERRRDLRILFFLHIPFPPPELFRRLPWRRAVLDGVLGADLVGFQTAPDMSNFVRSARMFGRAAGRAPVLELDDSRTVRVGAFPVTIDHGTFQRLAHDPLVLARSRAIREELGSPKTVLLGVDRLDYTKGIDLRLQAVGELLREGVLQVPDHVTVQIAVPTRGEVAAYVDLRDHVERLVGTINGEVATMGQPAVHYLHRSLPLDELVALYLAADVLLVTPLRDGMNLVAKEYVASRTDDTGALVLSEFAGAAHELRAAHLVNPHDIDSLKLAITRAVNGDGERPRMRRMRRVVLQRDVRDWANSMLSALP
ncbi:MAG TPA: trehalose-6-phosphate synthase [Acidimicrobiales bacterium]|jgi:trehalose 6-phosphate synthase|nr:trehalose-6-phosphate synthase [Acidimicrobiales bacterium]